MDFLAKGVELRRNRCMPYTQAAFVLKEKWRLRCEQPEAPTNRWAANYKTPRGRKGLLEEKIKEDLEEGKMIQMKQSDAKVIYGDRLLVGAPGLVEEGEEKFRLIHDGAHFTLVINRISSRAHLP